MAVISLNMPAAKQAHLAAQAAAMQLQQNRQFMALGIRKKALAQQANGGANKQAFVAGQPLTYNIPTPNNGFFVGFLGNFLLTVTLGAGTSAVYGLTAAAPLSVLDSIVVNYGGPQHNFRPYILKHYF